MVDRAARCSSSSAQILVRLNSSNFVEASFSALLAANALWASSSSKDMISIWVPVQILLTFLTDDSRDIRTKAWYPFLRYLDFCFRRNMRTINSIGAVVRSDSSGWMAAWSSKSGSCRNFSDSIKLTACCMIIKCSMDWFVRAVQHFNSTACRFSVACASTPAIIRVCRVSASAMAASTFASYAAACAASACSDRIWSFRKLSLASKDVIVTGWVSVEVVA